MTKGRISIITTSIVFIIIITFLIWPIKESPTILFALYDGGTNMFTIELKENGQYEIKNSSWLTSNNFRGSYTIADSTITLDKENIDNVILTKNLKICVCPADPLKICLIQVDDNGNKLNTHFGFTITMSR